MKKDMTAAYQAAEKLTPWNLEGGVLNGAPKITWLDETHFSYDKESRGEDGGVVTQYVKVSCETGEEIPMEKKEEKKLSEKTSLSPDGTKELFRDGWNLAVRDLETGQVKVLTDDGEEDNFYGRGGVYEGAVGKRVAGKDPMEGVLWSPDSVHFLFYRMDQRGVKELHLLQSYDEEGVESIRPRLHSYKCAFPEDEIIPVAYYYMGNAVTGEVKPLEIPAQMLAEDLLNPNFTVARWLDNGKAVWIMYIARAHKMAKFFIADTEGNVSNPVTEETEDFLFYDTYGVQDGYGAYRFTNCLTEDGKNVFWQSERDNFARLFAYDAKSGECLGAITPEDIIVDYLIHKDENNQWLYFTANHIKGFSDPYYQALCRVHFDGSDFAVLTPEDGTHNPTVCGDYVVDTWSRIDEPPVTVLRKTDGTLVREIVRADVSKLMEHGYIMPERFTVTASDGKTTLYGIMVKPADFDPEKTYPLIDYIYGGMQRFNVPKDFSWKGPIAGREVLGGLEEFAQLGFAGIILDGLGTPGLGKELHNICYENIHGCAGLHDHVTVLPELKEKYPFLDLDRIGMWGNSGGGCATSRALLEYPDVYKVGVSSAGNHDQRMYHNVWTENFYGTYKKEIYAKGDNTALAKNLKGKLFIVHGAMDDNVSMSQSIRLVDALIEADKDFDFLVLPRTDHNVPANPYFIRRKMDYFVKHLLGEEVPDYRFKK